MWTDRAPRPGIVRRATLADAAAIAAVHLASWHGAYADDAPEGWLDSQSLQGRIDAWQARLGEADAGRSTTLVVLADDGDDSDRTVIGFCGMSTPSLDRDAAPKTAGIGSFYIDPAHWRVGAGRALMTAALGELTRAGYERVTLWVLQTNARAQAFYAAFGLRDDGGRLLQTDWPTQIRMGRRLGDFPPPERKIDQTEAESGDERTSPR